jgi:hypothetical protein
VDPNSYKLGQYQIRDHIGVGGFGTVYRATHEQDGRDMEGILDSPYYCLIHTPLQPALRKISSLDKILTTCPSEAIPLSFST